MDKDDRDGRRSQRVVESVALRDEAEMEAADWPRLYNPFYPILKLRPSPAAEAHH